MKTIAEIKARFPKVSQSRPGRKSGYCVGGAICYTLNKDSGYLGFPHADTIAHYLTVLNKKLDIGTALEFAETICDLNDEGLFQQAWIVASEAEAYGYNVAGGERDGTS